MFRGFAHHLLVFFEFVGSFKARHKNLNVWKLIPSCVYLFLAIRYQEFLKKRATDNGTRRFIDTLQSFLVPLESSSCVLVKDLSLVLFNVVS